MQEFRNIKDLVRAHHWWIYARPSAPSRSWSRHFLPRSRLAYLRRRIEDLTAPREAPKSRKAEEPKHEDAAAANPVPSIMPGKSGKPGEPLTMSSREIADLLGARHDSVKRSIESLVMRAVFDRPQSVEDQIETSHGRRHTARVYLLDKRSSLIVVAQLSPEFTARVVDRWQELEERVATYQKAMNTFDEAEILRRIGGVVKAVTGRQIADLREGVEAALETIGRLAQELRAAKSAAAPTFDLAGTVTSRDVMDMAGIRPETRVRGTGLIITRHLKTYCLERGLAAFRTPTEIDVYRRWRFPREAAADWVTREQGGEIIRNHIATSLKRKGAKGQGLLHLVPTEKH